MAGRTMRALVACPGLCEACCVGGAPDPARRRWLFVDRGAPPGVDARVRPAARVALLLIAALAILLAPGARAQDDALVLSASEVKRRWHGRLDGRHFVAHVRLEMNLGGLRESRELRIWRDDEVDHHERVLIRFEAPADLRNVGLLYFEQKDQPNDYFL